MTKSDEIQPLVSVDELAAHLDDPNWVIVDCRFNLLEPDAGRKNYETAHIPGAFYADLDKDLASPASADGGGRHPLPKADQFRRLLRSWGVEAASKIVVYDEAGGAVASRLWWLSRWMGHEDAAVLDGGLRAWQTAEQALSAEIVVPARVETGADVGNLRPGQMPTVEAAQLETGLADNSLLLLDVRAPDRHSGKQEPIDAVAGHVPGARNVPFEDSLGTDGCFRPVPDLRDHYQSAIGSHPPSRLVCMCGSGVTACHTLLALEIAGIRGAALYVGSWSDWISSGTRPVATD